MGTVTSTNKGYEIAWGYRIIREKLHGAETKFFGKYIYNIHEVYYDKNGIKMWTEKPCRIIGNSKKDLISGLEFALRDCKKYKILDSDVLSKEAKKKRPDYRKAVIDEKDP